MLLGAKPKTLKPRTLNPKQGPKSNQIRSRSCPTKSRAIKGMRTLPPFCSPGSKEEEEAAAQLLPFPPPALALLSALPLTPKLALHCDALRPRPRVMVPWQGLQYLHNLARGRKMERGGTGQGRKAGSRAGVDWVACPMCRRGSHWRKEGILNFGFNKTLF